MAFPAGDALTIQGMVLMVAVGLGPAMVVTFSTLRTLTRFAFQLMQSIRDTVEPEMSAACGSNNSHLARKLHRCACQASLWSAVAASVALLFLGQRVLHLWTHGIVAMNNSLFHWLLLSVVVSSLWVTSSVVMIATNTHQRVAALYLFATSVSVGLAYPFMLRFGISGAAMALLVVDLLMGCYVLRTSLDRLGDRPICFFAALFTVPIRA
jgi:O-antigen/teichoic acid export membrane protein